MSLFFFSAHWLIPPPPSPSGLFLVAALTSHLALSKQNAISKSISFWKKLHYHLDWLYGACQDFLPSCWFSISDKRKVLNDFQKEQKLNQKFEFMSSRHVWLLRLRAPLLWSSLKLAWLITDQWLIIDYKWLERRVFPLRVQPLGLRLWKKEPPLVLLEV